MAINRTLGTLVFGYSSRPLKFDATERPMKKNEGLVSRRQDSRLPVMTPKKLF